MKKAFITGISGQDGSFLAEQLLAKGYEVHGLIRRSSVPRSRIAHIEHKLRLHYGDILDFSSLNRILPSVYPNEIYHLAAQSHVRVSFDVPVYTAESVLIGTTNLLEAYRMHCPYARYYQASSSEMFGAVLETPQRETTPFNPCSPYGCAKAAAHYLVCNYRKAYNLHASCGILFNHESERRGEEFVTRKITKAIGRILRGKQDTLFLGNLDAKRDWGYAPEYTDAMWRMLQQDNPSDFVIATGVTYSIRAFMERAFEYAGLDYSQHVAIDPALYRASEVDLLLGDASRAYEVLDWKPKTSLDDLVKLMVDCDEGIL